MDTRQKKLHHPFNLRHALWHAYVMGFAALIVLAIATAVPVPQSLGAGDPMAQLAGKAVYVEFPEGLPASELARPDIYLLKNGSSIATYSPGPGPSYNPLPLDPGTWYMTTSTNPYLTVGSDYTVDIGPIEYMTGAWWETCMFEVNGFETDCDATTKYPETMRVPPYGTQTYSYMGPFSVAEDMVTKVIIHTRYALCTIIGTSGTCAGTSHSNGYGDILFTAENLGDGTNLPSVKSVDRNFTSASDWTRQRNAHIGSVTHTPNSSYLLQDVSPNSGYQITFGSQSNPINGTFASTATWGTCTFPRGGTICTPSSYSSLSAITGSYGNAEKYAGQFSVSNNTITRVVVKYGAAAANAELTVRRVDETLSTGISGTTAGVDSQSSTTNPAVFAVASGQKTVTVTDLADTRERFASCTYSLPSGSCSLTATTSYAIADTCNGTTCSYSVNVPANTGVRVVAAYQPLKFIINAKTIVCDDESYLPNVQVRGDTNPVWAQSPIVSTPGSIATFLSSVGSNCHVEDGWDFQWSFYNSSPVEPTHTGAAPVPANGVGQYFNFDTTSGATGAGSAAQAFIYDAASSTGWGTALNPNLPNSGMFWFKTNLKSGYLPFTTPPYQADGGSPYSSELMCDVDRVNFDNWEWIRPRAGVTSYWCYMLTAQAGDTDDGSLFVHRVDEGGDELNQPATEVSIDPPTGSETDNPAEFEGLSADTDSTTVTFNDLDGFTEHVAVCTNIVSAPDCTVSDSDYDFIPGEPYGTDPIMPTCNGDECTFEVSVLPNIETHLYVKYDEQSARNVHILRVNDFLNLLAEDADGPKSYFDSVPGSIENPYEVENVSGGQHTFAVDVVPNYTVTYAMCEYVTGETPCYTYNATYSATTCTTGQDATCSVPSNVNTNTAAGRTRKVVFRYTPIEPTLQCSVSRTSVPLGGTVTYTGVSNYNNSNTTPMEYAWSGSFGNPPSSISCSGQPSAQCQRITLRFNQAGTVSGVSVEGTVGSETLEASCPAVNIIRSTIIEQ